MHFLRRWPPARAATAAVCAAALVGAGCVPPPPQLAQPRRAAPPATPAPAPDDHTVVLGADVLVRQYGLARADALARMRAQPARIAAALDLQARLGLPAGSVWIDHAGGGRVVARTASAGAADIAAAVGAQQGVEAMVVASEHTPTEIAATATDLAAALQAEGIDGFAVGYDPVTDTFALAVPPAAVPGEPPAETAEDAATDAGLQPDDVVVEEVPGIETAACTPDGRHCDPPLRGGPVMRGPTATGIVYCSAGFVGRTASSGAPVVLTAGHCAAGAGPASVWSAYVPGAAAWRELGTAAGTAFGAQGDSAAVGVRDATGWAPGPALVAGPVSTAPAGVRSQSYRIEAIQRPVVGAVLCLSGSSAGTSCGEVTQVGASVAYSIGTSTVVVNGLAALDLRGRGSMCTGDSGGPVYANSLGFGLVSGGSLSGSTRTIDNGVYRVTVACGNGVVFLEDLPRAASRLGVVVGARDWRARGWL